MKNSGGSASAFSSHSENTMRMARPKTSRKKRTTMLITSLVLFVITAVTLGITTTRRTNDADVARTFEAENLEIALMQYLLDH